MLVMARKAKQKILLYLDGQVIAEIVITSLTGNTVRLGIVAPPRVEIWREENDPHERRQQDDAA